MSGKITLEVLENIGIDLLPMGLAEEREMGLIMEILEYFEFDVESMRVNENEAWPMSAARSHNSKYFEKLTLEALNKTANNLSKSKQYHIFIWDCLRQFLML